MKILAFSDLHRNREMATKIVQASSAADVVVGAGDFGTQGLGVSDTIDILREITVPIIIVSGNHDRLNILRNLCLDWKNCHLLHGAAVSVGGVVFFGLGYEIPKRLNTEWNQYLSDEEAAVSLSLCPHRAILVTHTPPIDHCDLQRDGSHEGSESIRNTIELRSIKLHLCGHIHHSWGTTSIFKDCIIQNLGPTINWFDV